MIPWTIAWALAICGLMVGALGLAVAIHLASRRNDAIYDAARWECNAHKAARAMHRIMERQGALCGGCDCAPELLDDAAVFLAEEAWEEFVWVPEPPPSAPPASTRSVRTDA